MKLNVKKHFLPAVRTAAGVLLVSLLGMAFAQTPPTGTAASGPVVARLGTITISQTEVQRLLRDLPDADRAAILADRAATETWLRQRITGEAVVREARSKGWADKPEIKARINDAVRELTVRIISAGYLESVGKIPDNYPSEAETQTAYEQGKAGFNLPPLYHVAQIFVKAPANDKAALPAAREKAKMLATQARQGDFAVVARANSDDARSAQRGGDVGTLPLANFLPALQDSVAKLKKGQVTEPIQTDAGFHIVKLLDSQASRTAAYEEIKPRLQAIMRQQRQQQAVQTYLTGLAPAGSITIDNAALDAALSKTN